MERFRKNAVRATFAACVAIVACACSEPSAGTGIDAAAIVVSPNPWPTPQIAAPNSAPRIIALWMNETSIPSGSEWYGRAITSTNVASLEIRTESFSFVAQRVAFGDFRFHQHMLDMVPFYKRAYVLHVIARNAAGNATERHVPIVFR
jgi:hypothetical protein